MKKTRLLHSDLSYVIATMGHLDTLVIADAGLPIPDNTMRIDLAEEVKERNPSFLAEVQELLPGVS
jgi:D-ribose pyranase